MLQCLHVKNLALIRDCEVQFGPGLNILTGETGAGKSILIGSVQLALGGRMSRDMLREGADYGYVELTFTVEDPRATARLKDLDVFLEDGQVILSRRVMENRSVCRINGETCTLNHLKQAAACLLDLHGQNEHQSLLDREKQLSILDQYGREEILPAREETAKSYRAYAAVRKELSSLNMAPEQQKRERDFLQFEIQEIDEANLAKGEDEELEQQFRKLNNSREIAEALQQAHQYTGYENSGSAGELLSAALSRVNAVSEYDTRIADLASVLGDIDGLLNDFNRELSAYLNDLTFDEEELYRIQQRLDLINNLKAKYGDSLDQIQAYRDSQQKKLDDLIHYEEHRLELRDRLDRTRQELESAAANLTQIRQKWAQKLEKEILGELQDLNFEDVRFSIHFDRTPDYTSGGVDEITYLISTNPGEPLKPLSKVISGGELSRIMLAIKTILADQDEVETLIFDEIDAGISGRTAQKVSEKLARIGQSRQVICITHLPQIASMADVHYGITKYVQDQETFTNITKLGQEDSIEELARLLGGAQITDAVLENAREMKALAVQQKNHSFQIGEMRV